MRTSAPAQAPPPARCTRSASSPFSRPWRPSTRCSSTAALQRLLEVAVVAGEVGEDRRVSRRSKLTGSASLPPRPSSALLARRPPLPRPPRSLVLLARDVFSLLVGLASSSDCSARLGDSLGRSPARSPRPKPRHRAALDAVLCRRARSLVDSFHADPLLVAGSAPASVSAAAGTAANQRMPPTKPAASAVPSASIGSRVVPPSTFARTILLDPSPPCARPPPRSSGQEGCWVSAVSAAWRLRQRLRSVARGRCLRRLPPSHSAASLASTSAAPSRPRATSCSRSRARAGPAAAASGW